MKLPTLSDLKCVQPSEDIETERRCAAIFKFRHFTVDVINRRLFFILFVPHTSHAPSLHVPLSMYWVTAPSPPFRIHNWTFVLDYLICVNALQFSYRDQLFFLIFINCNREMNSKLTAVCKSCPASHCVCIRCKLIVQFYSALHELWCICAHSLRRCRG